MMSAVDLALRNLVNKLNETYWEPCQSKHEFKEALDKAEELIQYIDRHSAMKTLKHPTFAVWFAGIDEEPNSICYKGRDAFFTTDYKEACNYRDELLSLNPGCTYIVVELKEIEE